MGGDVARDGANAVELRHQHRGSVQAVGLDEAKNVYVGAEGTDYGEVEGQRKRKRKSGTGEGGG